jgi:LmbE family N-acetylglucosaminyl deacetylase
MAIFAHPDDAEFVAGGSLAIWSAEGRQRIYVFCTDGGKGSSDPSTQSGALVHARQTEQRAAAHMLGCEDVVFLPYEDAMLEPTLALRRDLTRAIRRYRPQIVLCFDPTVFWINEYYIQHPDHRASGEAALAAIFPSARDRLTFPELLAEGLEPHNVEEIYLASPQEANRWIDVGATMDKKLAALFCHTSQFQNKPFIENLIRAAAREAGKGCGCGVEYAEAFRYISMNPRRRPGME